MCARRAGLKSFAATDFGDNEEAEVITRNRLGRFLSALLDLPQGSESGATRMVAASGGVEVRLTTAQRSGSNIGGAIMLLRGR
ncbi:hypothetical protein CBW54_09660 [Yersinia kristensenii]|nr:hypothetical protein CBW54_09660 [Yersinia kristensenii]